MRASVFVQSRATLLGVRKANPFAVFVISARLQRAQDTAHKDEKDLLLYFFSSDGCRQSAMASPADRLGSGRGAATFQIETTGRKTPTYHTFTQPLLPHVLEPHARHPPRCAKASPTLPVRHPRAQAPPTPLTPLALASLRDKSWGRWDLRARQAVPSGKDAQQSVGLRLSERG